MAEDNFTKAVDDIGDQFKQMHDDLDKLTASTKRQTEATKEQTKAQTNDQKDKKKEQKERKGRLDDLRAQVRRSQIEQGLSAKDVAAEHIAGGGGIGGAVKAAAGFKVGQLKHKFDPLNIVKKITGGSKLLTALAGKLMGRSERSIREFTDLAPGQELPTSFSGKASKISGGGGYGQGPSRVSGGDSSELLVTIAANVAKILDRLTRMETSTVKQERLAQEQLDAQRDEAAEEAAKKPSRLGKITSSIKGLGKGPEKGGGIFDMIADFGKGLFGSLMKSLFSPLGLAFAGLVAAGTLLYRQWDQLKLSFSLLGDSISDVWEAIKSGLASMAKWVGDTMTSIGDSIIDVGENVIEGVKHLNPFYKGPTEEEKLNTLKNTAAGTGFMAGHAQRKLEAMNVDKVAAPGEGAAATARLSGSFAGKIPAAAQEKAAEGLKKGEYDAAATASLMGTAAPTGSPEQKATTNAVTQLATKAYGEVFKDKAGKPLTPSTDTAENRATRVPMMVREASNALGGTLSGPQITPTSPTEIPTTAPATGQMLNQASENQKNASVGGGATNVVAPVVNQHKTVNNTSSTTIHQNMPPARSGESSFLRSQDSSFARA